MGRPTAILRITPLILMFSLTLGALPAHALLMVDGTVQAVGPGVWQYDFTVGNSGPDDVILVSLLNVPVDDLLIAPSLTAPAGFQASYDSNAILNMAFMDFLEDTSLFAVGSSIGLFSFESGAAPGTAFTMFEAIELDFDIVSGQTNLTVIDGEIPLPGTCYLALAAITLLAAFRQRTPMARFVNRQP